MGILSKLFSTMQAGAKTNDTIDPKSFLDELERLASADVKAATKYINRHINQIGNHLRCGEELHKPFADLLVQVITQTALEKGQNTPPPMPLPAVQIVRSKDCADWGSLMNMIRPTNAPVIYVQYPDFYGPPDSQPHYAVLETEALWLFSRNRQTMLIFIDEVNFFAARSFLYDAAAAILAGVGIDNLNDALFDYAESKKNLDMRDGVKTPFNYPIMVFYETGY